LREETRLELTGIQERVGTTFLVVTHDQEEALGMAQRVAVMNHGRLVQTGPPAEIYERPNSRFVADFVGAVNLFDGELVAGFNALSLKIRGCEQPIALGGTAPRAFVDPDPRADERGCKASPICRSAAVVLVGWRKAGAWPPL
jgi:ABC-type Fe3+/spermidine/putrescine transport system ATPase subunit